MFTNIVSSSVGKDVIERICLRNVFRRLADDDGELDFVVRKMLLNGLDMLRDSDRDLWANEGRDGLVEQDRITECGVSGHSLRV